MWIYVGHILYRLGTKKAPFIIVFFGESVRSGKFSKMIIHPNLAQESTLRSQKSRKEQEIEFWVQRQSNLIISAIMTQVN